MKQWQILWIQNGTKQGQWPLGHLHVLFEIQRDLRNDQLDSGNALGQPRCR